MSSIPNVNSPITLHYTIDQNVLNKLHESIKSQFKGSYIRHNMYDHYAELFVKVILDQLNIHIVST